MRRLLPVLLLACAACASDSVLGMAFGPGGRTIGGEIATFPPEQREAFALMEQRCARCHRLSQAFAVHIAAESWSPLVRKMARKPGAAIRPEEAERIAAFMGYFQERRDKVGGK